MTKHLQKLRKLRVPLLLAGLAASTGLAVACSGHDGDGEVAEFGTPGGGETVPLDCSMPRPGCPCDDEGIKVVCGEQVGMSGDQVVCGKGTATCVEGEYTACAVDHSITLGSGFFRPLTQGTPVECPDPCDPYCWTFNDDPTGECNPDAGVC
ncbi:MAG: hypothetical protein JRI68_33410 [Deltaproteobacteria bacterium]|nr:hypothetical protein [Deltaproteobacteria bacterium]